MKRKKSEAVRATAQAAQSGMGRDGTASLLSRKVGLKAVLIACATAAQSNFGSVATTAKRSAKQVTAKGVEGKKRQGGQGENVLRLGWLAVLGKKSPSKALLIGGENKPCLGRAVFSRT